MDSSPSNKKVNPLFGFVVYGNLWISLGACLLAFQTMLLMKLEVNYYLLLFVFSSTVFAYSFQRLFKYHSAVLKRDVWVVAHRRLVAFLVFLSMFGMLYSLLALPVSVYPMVLLLGSISIGYSLRFIPFGGKRYALRDLPFMKINLIALTWAASSAFLPVLLARGWSALVEPRVLFLFLWYFFFIYAITLPFDIRDVRRDESLKKTVPQLIGLKKALVLAQVFLLLGVILATGAWMLDYIKAPVFGALTLSNALTALILRSFKKDRPDAYYLAILDGTLVYQFLLVFLALRFF